MWRVLVLTAAALGSIVVGPATAAPQERGTVVAVAMGEPSEFALKLSRSSVPVGAVVFEVTNRGRLPHQFTICTATSATRGGCRGTGTSILAPGKSATVRIDFVRSGGHEYLSSAGCEADLGMTGTLVVVGAGPAV